jgi:hypothetical protein
MKTETAPKTDIDPDEVYEIEDGAPLAFVSERLLRKFCAEGKLPGAKKRGPGRTNKWTIPGVDLLRVWEQYRPACA